MKNGKILILISLIMGISVFFISDPSEGKSRFTDKDSIVVALTTEVLSLDTQMDTGTPAENIKRHLYEGLVFADEQNKIHPRLAEKWEVAGDGVTWTFYLKKGVKFHDNTDFTARAVQKTFERILDPATASSHRHLYTVINSVRVVDDFTVQIVTKEPKGNFINLIAHGPAHPISPAAIDKWGKDLANNPCGTGRFRIDKKVAGESVVLKRFNDYWGDKAKLSEIKFVTVPEEGTRVMMLENGEADFILNVPPQDIERLSADKSITLRKDQSNRIFHIGINVTKPPLDNNKVRQALNYGVDQELIIRGALGGIGLAAKSVVAPSTWGYSPVSPYSYNTEKAKKLLAEAGFENGFKVKLGTPQGRYFRDKEVALAVAGQLKKIGVEVDVEVIEWGQYLKELKLGKNEGNTIEMFLLGWVSVTGEANHLLNTVFLTDNISPKGWNNMFYSNKKVDELIYLSSKTIDDNKRAEMFKQCQEIVINDAP